jgi:hypothetical protein
VKKYIVTQLDLPGLFIYLSPGFRQLRLEGESEFTPTRLSVISAFSVNIEPLCMGSADLISNSSPTVSTSSESAPVAGMVARAIDRTIRRVTAHLSRLMFVLIFVLLKSNFM